MTEILPFSDVTESRRTVRADTDGLGILLPESVLSKRYASNETRMPPLQGNTLFEVERFPFLGDNQGGTAKCIFVPEAAFGSLRDFCLFELLFY